MLFIMGIYDQNKELGSKRHTDVCPQCGRFCSYKEYMRYTCLSLFFIPVLKWGKEYYAESSCCGHRKSINNQCT